MGFLHDHDETAEYWAARRRGTKPCAQLAQGDEALRAAEKAAQRTKEKAAEIAAAKVLGVKLVQRKGPYGVVDILDSVVFQGPEGPEFAAIDRSDSTCWYAGVAWKVKSDFPGVPPFTVVVKG